MRRTLYYFIMTILIQQASVAKILDYKTTRLRSTGGTGVASLLMDEATVLNPAPLAFFNMSSVYVEKSTSDNKDLNENDLNGSSNLAVIASDSSKALKGSLSYVKAKRGKESFKQLSSSFASAIGKKSSLGFTYQKIDKEEEFQNLSSSHSYSQLNIGVFHAITSSLSMGLVAMDPFEKSENATKAILGLQYQYGKFISVMFDAGADYRTELSERSLVRGAIQFNVLSDIYLRAGMFDDKIDMQSGSGFGISWIQPKLTLNFAVSNISVEEDIVLKQIAEEVSETSFSLSYRF